MSPHAMNTFVSDLVEMARATETLPQVQADLADARQTINQQYDTIQRLELKLLERAAEIDKLHADVRNAEVAKDAAETMFLEADERTSRALDFIKATFGNAGTLIQALEPPKPVEVSVPPSPTPVPPVSTTGGTENATPSSEPVGQSVADPTGVPTPTSSSASSSEPGTTTGDVSTVAGPSTDPAPGPYSGKRYIDIPGWVSREDWLAGGGTDADYDYRG